MAETPDTMDSLARDYVLLSLTIGEKEEGYIDAYYGPPQWQAEAKMKSAAPAELAQRAGVLAVRLRSLADPRLDPMERRRRDFPLAQLKAASTRLAMMQGAKLPFAEEAGSRDHDQYGRKLRILMQDGESLGMRLVREGLARPWTGHRMPWC